jgi:aspartyl-tRNA(Asn)/glutamyl-tRNA(Gln) amidotransferase subunit A
MDQEICALGAAELVSMYRRGDISPVEVTRQTLDRVEALQPAVNAYISVLADSALAAARIAEAQFLAGIETGPLQGVPVSLKDNIHLRGVRTTAASRARIDAPVERRSATVAARLEAAGAIIVGKTNLHEFAFGDPDPGSPFGLVQNPRRIGYQPAGSSSGSAAATASGQGVVSIGSDTAGSIRAPATACGVVGFKPTHGLVSIDGVIPVSPEHDHLGPLARSVHDAAAAMTVIAGWDPADPHSRRAPRQDFVSAVVEGPGRVRLGIPDNPEFRFGLAEPLALLDQARSLLCAECGDAVGFSFKNLMESTDLLHDTLMPPSVWLYHQGLGYAPELYGRHFLEWSGRGQAIGGLQYLTGLRAQEELRREWRRLFEQVDVVLMPANVGVVLPHGQKTVMVDGVEYPMRRLLSKFNALSNITGNPSLIVPIGQHSGLPVCAQLVGPPGSDGRVLAVGAVLERVTGNVARSWGVDPVYAEAAIPADVLRT